jgi:hypothetical protein
MPQDIHPDGTVLTNSNKHVMLKRDGEWLAVDRVPWLLWWRREGYHELPVVRGDWISWDEFTGPDVRPADAAVSEAAHKFAEYLP